MQHELRTVASDLAKKVFHCSGKVTAHLWGGEKFPHSIALCGEAYPHSSEASGGEDLDIEEPVSGWDCSTLHFHATLAGMLSATLI